MSKRESTLGLPEFDMLYYAENLRPLLNPFQNDHAAAEFGRGIRWYIQRIQYTGLDSRDRVLDAGGGMGNWAIPLALINKHVDVVDIASDRLFVGRAMANHLGIENVDFTYMSIEDLDFKNDSFDIIICYSVIMFTEISKSLAEFHRVLKPGGRLFIQADLWRWYFGQSFPRSGRLLYALKFAAKKLIFGKPILLTSESLRSCVEKSGFRVVSFGQDGEASFESRSADNSVKSFYPTQPEGKEELIEICAEKI